MRESAGARKERWKLSEVDAEAKAMTEELVQSIQYLEPEPGSPGPWYQAVQSLSEGERDDGLEFAEPPEGTVPGSSPAQTRRAEEAVRNSKVLPTDMWPVLRLLYEFNALTQRQIELALGLSKPTTSRRLNKMFDGGLIRGITLGMQKAWTLSIVGARAGRAIYSVTGPLIPFEPGTDPNGENEELRVWGEKFVGTTKKLAHDLHVASWVLAMVELFDGDTRFVMNPDSGVVSSVSGEFGLFQKVPWPRSPRGEVMTNWYDLHQLVEGHGFEGRAFWDEENQVGNLHPDAAIRLHLPQSYEDWSREIWVEMDRQGRIESLKAKFRNFDYFYGIWWRALPRFAKAGPPLVVFVAPNLEVLQRQLRIADETLTLRGGRRIDGAENWPAPWSRGMVRFALEEDIHKGSTRTFRVPAWPPHIRAVAAGDGQERNFPNAIRQDELFGASLLAGNRDGTRRPSWAAPLAGETKPK